MDEKVKEEIENIEKIKGSNLGDEEKKIMVQVR